MSTGADLLGIPLRHGRLHFPQTLADPENSIDEHAVGGALDLKVAEERVSAEQRQRLVEDVVALALGVDLEVVCAGGEGGESVCWAAGLGAEGGESKVAYGVLGGGL